MLKINAVMSTIKLNLFFSFSWTGFSKFTGGLEVMDITIFPEKCLKVSDIFGCDAISLH
jgi:hypothetical protein